MRKKSVVGVSISPEMGLEVAQLDYSTGTVMKYGRKSIEYNVAKREIADLDLFKDTLFDLLNEMAIQPGTELVLSMPTVVFKVTDYPNALEDNQIDNAIEDDLYENVYLKNYEPCYSRSIVNSTLQFKKVAYTAIQKSTIIELVMSIKERGYKVSAIDTSVNSVLKSLVYLDRVNTEPDTNWVLLLVDNSSCRIISMLGRKYIDVFEEKISIGNVLSDAENYATVIAAIEPILRNLPSKYLCVVSKTNVISAEALSNKINYSAPIIYQEANGFLKEPLLNVSSLVDAEYTKAISLDVIGAAIYKEYAANALVDFNLFNKTLGDVYLMEQPPSLFGGKLVLSKEFLMFIGSVIIGIIVALTVLAFGWFAAQNSAMEKDIKRMEGEIAKINEFLEKNKDISTDTFDEGEQIRLGLTHNKNIYSYYTIVGTEIPQKLWLTHLKLSDKTTIEGQADNIESIYAFFRSIKDYNPKTDITLQNLGLATDGPREFTDSDVDIDSILTTLDADFYEFRISNETIAPVVNTDDNDKKSKKKSKKSKTSKSSKKSGSAKSANDLPELEVIK